MDELPVGRIEKISDETPHAVPDGAVVIDIAGMRSELGTLRAELAALKAERDKLRAKADSIEEAWRDIQGFVAAAYNMACRGNLAEPEGEGAIVDLLRMAFKEPGRVLRETGRMSDLEGRVSDLEQALTFYADGITTSEGVPVAPDEGTIARAALDKGGA